MSSAMGWMVSAGSGSSKASMTEGSRATDSATPMSRSWCASRMESAWIIVATTPATEITRNTMPTCSSIRWVRSDGVRDITPFSHARARVARDQNDQYNHYHQMLSSSRGAFVGSGKHRT